MRLTVQDWAMKMAQLTAERSTCLRRHVGCVMLNARGHVVSTGYNGVAAGQKHCNEFVEKRTFGCHHAAPTCQLCDNLHYPNACPGAKAASGTQLDGCHAIHAEQNALLQCKDVYSIESCYVTASPCMTCTKLLMNTSCQKIYFLEEYPHPEARDLWLSTGREWIKHGV